MKKVTLVLFLFICGTTYSLDRVVDPNLSGSNGTTLFTTITSAVNASVNGDRILIKMGTYNEPTLTISKSLTLISQTAGTKINFNGNIVIAGFPGMKLEILGFNLGIYSVSSNTIPSGNVSSRAKISFIECKMQDLSVNQDFYELNCALCSISGITTFRFGNFVASKTNNLDIIDEPNSNNTHSYMLIANDTITGRLSIRNDDYQIKVVNNRLNEFYYWKWNFSSVLTNFITNNDFISNCKIFIPSNPPNYNIDFSNNYFEGFVNYVRSNGCNGGWDGTEGRWCPGSYPLRVSRTLSGFPGVSVSGYFKWTYNGIDLPCTIPSGSNPLVLTKIIGDTLTNINTGNPNHIFYDIDLTINDRGRTGGPYSILNYNPTINPGNGKAYIFDLEMPTDIFPGQSVDIKAKGYHKN